PRAAERRDGRPRHLRRADHGVPGRRGAAAGRSRLKFVAPGNSCQARISGKSVPGTNFGEKRAWHEFLLRDADDLGLHVALQADDRVLAAEPGFLRAAERHERARRAVLVDPRGADLEPLRDRLAALEIVRPHGTGQAVARVVRAPDRVLDVRELQDRHDRSELLFLHEAALLVDIRDERRRYEIAGALRYLAAAEDPCAAPLRLLDDFADLVVLH